MDRHRPPVIFLAFANDRGDGARYLRNLPEETRQLQKVLDQPGTAHLYELVVRSNITLRELLDVLQDPRYRGRIAVFHFGGHAGDMRLWLESTAGDATVAHGEGLAGLLGLQQGLELVFLNGCSTEPQVEGLLSAGVPAVIATSESIGDAVATELASRFYRAMAGGATIARAWTEAVDSVRAWKGEAQRDLYRQEEPTGGRWPWELYLREGAEIVKEWSLPRAAGDPLFGLPPLPKRDLPETPYRHLQWFREEDAELFFGRGREIRAFYEHVVPASAAPIVLFYGQSGVGKSSLLDAGLVPRLRASHQVRYARRDRDVGLTGALAAALGDAAPGQSLGATWHALEAASGAPLTVIMDQVEEVYTRPRPTDSGEFDQFVRVLDETFASRATRPRGRLVLGFRKEWLAEIEQTLRAARLTWSRFYLDRLDRDGIVEIVEGPTRSTRLKQHFRLTVAQGLADDIAHDMLEDRDAPVAPPLEVLLTKMWDVAREGSEEAPAFTTEVYQDLRRKGLLLDDFVEEQLRALRNWNPQVIDSGLALDVLAFHTTPLGTAESRTPAELEEAYPHRGAVLPALVQQGKDLYLLVDKAPDAQAAGSQAPGTRLSHDTVAPLIRRRFRDSDAPGQRARRILENRGEEWRDAKAGNPLDEADLRTVEAGEAGTRHWTNDEVRLIEASRGARRRRRVLWRGLVGAGAVGFAVIVGLIFSARANERSARESERRAESRRLAVLARAESEKEVAALLGVEAVREHATSEAWDALLVGLQREAPLIRVLGSHQSAVRGVAFSPDGATLASAGDSSIRLWDVKGRRLRGDPLSGHIGGVSSVAFSSDGFTLASGGDDGTIRLWNATTRQLRDSLIGHKGSVRSVMFGPSGATLASASDDGTIRLWDMRTRSSEGNSFVGFTGMAFSPDGTTLALIRVGGTIVLWNLQMGRRMGEFMTGQAGVDAIVAFSPDGRTLASTGGDGTIRLWDVRTGRPRGDPLVGHTSPYVNSASFSPDGSTLASTSRDGTIRLWHVQTGRPLGDPIGDPKEGAIHATFSPDGTMLASGGDDGAIRLWDVRVRRTLGERLGDHQHYVQSVAFSPDGTMLASGSFDNTIRLWDVQTRRPRGDPLVGHRKAVFSVAFDPDSRTLASASEDSTARLWDAQTGRSWGNPLVFHKSHVSSVVFSPDGTKLASGSGDGSVCFWGARTLSPRCAAVASRAGGVSNIALSPDGTLLASVSYDRTICLSQLRTRPLRCDPLSRRAGGVSNIAFSPDGATLALAGGDGTIRLLDVRTLGQRGDPLTGHREAVTSVAFSPDGTTLASASADSTIRLWDLQTRRMRGDALIGHESGVSSVAFSPDGTTLASGSLDNTVRLWPGEATAWVGLVCATSGSNLPLAVWERVFPERPYRCTCSNLPPGEGVQECPGSSTR